MAYDISMWKADGSNGECELKTIRIGRVEQLSDILAHWTTIPECVRILQTRSDNKKYEKQLWIKPGYKDPFV